MSQSKLLTVFAACLPIVLAGCGGGGGGGLLSCTINGVSVSCDDYPRMSAAVDEFNNLNPVSNAAHAAATEAMNAARASGSAADISAARAAVSAAETAFQATRAVLQRMMNAGVPGTAERLTNVEAALSIAQDRKTELDRLARGGSSSRASEPDEPGGSGAGGSGGSGNSGADTPTRPIDFDPDGNLAYEIGFSGTDGRLYPEGFPGDLYFVDLSEVEGGSFRQSIVKKVFDVREIGLAGFAYDGRLRDSYLPLATINAVELYISNHEVSTGRYAGYVERNIAAWGQYAAILSTGRFDCPDNCTRSGPIYGFHFGNGNLNHQEVSGRWAGAMAATDISTSLAVVGEAYVEFDPSIFGHDTGNYRVGVNTPPDVTVRFRNIREIDNYGIVGQTGTYSGPTQIDWNLETSTRFGWFGQVYGRDHNGDLVSYGFGRNDIAHPTEGKITGRFFGPDEGPRNAHEVAGIFEYYYGGETLAGNIRKEGIVGAFLAK